jgi:GTP-binding protein
MAAKAELLGKAARKKPLVLSAVSGAGMKEALYALAREIGRGRNAEEEARLEAEGERPAWRP